jgi:CarD family transcriptional regulator
MEKIKTGSVFEIAEVLRNLFLLRHSKDLSFGERKMLDQAKALLVKEISLARRADEASIEQEIQTIFTS